MDYDALQALETKAKRMLAQGRGFEALDQLARAVQQPLPAASQLRLALLFEGLALQGAEQLRAAKLFMQLLDVPARRTFCRGLFKGTPDPHVAGWLCELDDECQLVRNAPSAPFLVENYAARCPLRYALHLIMGRRFDLLQQLLAQKPCEAAELLAEAVQKLNAPAFKLILAKYKDELAEELELCKQVQQHFFPSAAAKKSADDLD